VKEAGRCRPFSLATIGTGTVNSNQFATGSCEVAHSFARPVELGCCKAFDEDRAISNDDYSGDREKSRHDNVEPDVLFVDGIVHDEALRYCSLAVDDLSRVWNTQVGTLDLQPGDVAANDAYVPLGAARARSDDARRATAQRQSISGWAPFLWMRIKAYFSI
jgi:hypothetical protein